MKVTEFLHRKAIVPSLKARDKKTAISEIVQILKKAHDPEKFNTIDVTKTILDRERQGSTGIGGGVAIPHLKLDGLKSVLAAFGRCLPGIDFGSPDGEPVSLLFLIVSPASKPEMHLQAVQGTMRAVRQPNVIKFLKAAKNAKDIEEIFREADELARV